MSEFRSPYAWIHEEDPHRELMIDPPKECVHGNGVACECQLPWYKGLFIWPSVDEHGKERHIVSHMKQSYGGGMREFMDPVSGEIVGCCGMNYAFAKVKQFDEFAAFHRDPPA